MCVALCVVLDVRTGGRMHISKEQAIVRVVHRPSIRGLTLGVRCVRYRGEPLEGAGVTTPVDGSVSGCLRLVFLSVLVE